jgi:parvulin-like peptidyl-prolyl isomerase
LTRRASSVTGRAFPWEGLDQERRNALLLYGAIGVVLVIAAALVAWGYYKDKIAPRHETVLTVGSRNFDVAFVERRVRANARIGNLGANSTLQDIVLNALKAIELEEVLRQTAKLQGMTVTDADIDNEIRVRLGLPSGVARNVFAAGYRSEVLRTGLPVKEYREIIAAQIIQERLTTQFQDAAPNQAEQVDAQIIKTKDEATIKDAKQRLDRGDKFNLTAASLSIDSSKDQGGELGWVTQAELTPKAGETLFSLPVGQVSDPVQDYNGWYIVLARDKQTRDVDGAQKQRIAAQTLDNTLQQTRVKVGSTSKITDRQVLDIGTKALKG